MKYDHQKIEQKWQKKWLDEKIYSPDIKNAKNPFYNLWMYPYPSAEGLHAGHAFASTGSDIYGRFMRMHGKDVFQPIGYDSFGIHSENYALKIGEHPKKMLDRTTKHYEFQLKKLGHGYDWTKTVTVSEPNYYRFTQWLFLQLFKAGLAYQKEAEVNFCPSCKTVIADEQVIGGLCERCDSQVEKKSLKQWFFRITDYADRLLEGHKKIDWSERVIVAQRNWIGKKEGARIKFALENHNFELEVFTTRPDTLYGTTFIVVSPSFVKKNLLEFVDSQRLDEVKNYISEAEKKRGEEGKDKTGVFLGLLAKNPASGASLPVFVADYVLDDYGTGVVMGVPAHDQRDWEFASKYHLQIVPVISSNNDYSKSAYDGEGEIINSGNWNGKKYPDDIEFILSDLEKNGWGKREVNYHLRDWLISRQRYWGPPIPLVYCQSCAEKGLSYFKDSIFKGDAKVIRKDQSDWDPAGWWPVDEKDLPVLLPELSDWKPEGSGKGPLANHPEFYKTKCPHCGGDAIRETDVSDTFLDSSWYFLRYPSVGIDDKPFDPEITEKWLPVDLYFGGAEHSVLHLMYARFITMVLYDLGLVSFDEPFPRFFAHGLMIKDGAKMSKSRGNVVNPDSYIEKYGADTLRLYLMFMGPMDGYPDFRDEGIEGMRRFVERLWKLFESGSVELGEKEAREIKIKMNQTIKKVTEDIESFRYNTAIAQIMIFVNSLENFKGASFKGGDDKVWDEAIKNLVLMLAPFAPHLAEEVWQMRFAKGEEFKSVHFEPWPKYNPALVVEETVKIPVQVNGKLRGIVELPFEQAKDEDKVVEMAKSDEKISKWLGSGKIKKTIFVPAKLLNFVTI
ncbi:MAG: leucine--tRNA ligase [Patescibacteria group bacterium]|nr:MAG: leucine--tRNA ligase [Patescibacteria group bacterium]